jgi:hypothetical protein
VKIIEALKQVKDLQRKASDLQRKVAANCALMENEMSPYQDPEKQVAGWIQSYQDTVKEILRLRIAIQYTNLVTKVTIEIGDNNVTKSIAEWVHRRRDLARMERDIYKCLTDRGLSPKTVTGEKGGEFKTINVKRFFDAAERDTQIGIFDNEPYLIDAKLEITNAITTLIEEMPEEEKQLEQEG